MYCFDAVEIGARVRKLREDRAMTIGKLSEEMNRSRDHMSKAERGVRSYSIDLLIELSVFFDVSLDYLVFGRNRSQPEIRDDILTVIADLTEIARKL